MMPYLSCKKIKNDVYNFPTWQYCKYKDIFDSRIIINSTAKFYISISYHKDLLSIDTRIFTPSDIQNLHTLLSLRENVFYSYFPNVLLDLAAAFAAMVLVDSNKEVVGATGDINTRPVPR